MGEVARCGRGEAATRSRYASVVFDLDGTLVDSSTDIAVALNAALVPEGGRRLVSDEVAPLLDEGASGLVEQAARLVGIEVVDGYVAELTSAYLEAYRLRPAVHSTLYEGVADALARLAAAGVPMTVCTNKTGTIADLMLDGLGVRGHFGAVVGADRVEHPKPHPDHLLEAFRDLRADPGRGVLVGDSRIDEQCARSARVSFLAVAWAPPEVDGPRLASYDELPDIVAGAAT